MSPGTHQDNPMHFPGENLNTFCIRIPDFPVEERIVVVSNHGGEFQFFPMLGNLQKLHLVHHQVHVVRCQVVFLQKKSETNYIWHICLLEYMRIAWSKAVERTEEATNYI